MELKNDPRLIEARLKSVLLSDTIKYMRGMREVVGDDREYVRLEDCFERIGGEVGTLIRELKEEYSMKDIEKELR
jgi:hypothetical protein